MEKALTVIRTDMAASGLDFFSVADISFQFEERSISTHEGKIVGLTEFKSRSEVSQKPPKTTYRSLLSWTNLLVDAAVKIDIAGFMNKTGNIQADIANCTLLIVTSSDSTARTFTLDDYQPIVYDVRITREGVGPIELRPGSASAEETSKRMKEPVMFIFNGSIKRIVRAAIEKVAAEVFGAPPPPPPKG